MYAGHGTRRYMIKYQASNPSISLLKLIASFKDAQCTNNGEDVVHTTYNCDLMQCVDPNTPPNTPYMDMIQLDCLLKGKQAMLLRKMQVF